MQNFPATTLQQKIGLIDEGIKLDQENIRILKQVKNQNNQFVKIELKAAIESTKTLLELRKKLLSNEKGR